MGNNLLSRLIKQAHFSYIFKRRTLVLSNILADKTPLHLTVLDIGCGDGSISRMILNSRKDLSITGIDVKKRDNCVIDCQEYDGVHIPYGDASFDLCMMVDVLHHTKDIREVLSEVCRVSRRYILIKDHCCNGTVDSFLLRLMDWVGNNPHGIVLPYNYAPSLEWKEIFDGLGLRTVAKQDDLRLYPRPVDLIFGRNLHFVILLEKDSKRTTINSLPS